MLSEEGQRFVCHSLQDKVMRPDEAKEIAQAIPVVRAFLDDNPHLVLDAATLLRECKPCRAMSLAIAKRAIDAVLRERAEQNKWV